jgi:flagellar biosynthetic protein FliR
LITYLADDVTVFFLVFCRIGACFMVLPGLSSMRVPVQVRLYAALTISVALAGFLAPPAPDSALESSKLLLAIINELLIGIYFGLIVRFYLLALEFIAAGIAMTVGFGGMLGAPIEGQESQSALSSFISFSALLMLFMLDFHHMVLGALIRTYDLQPMQTLPDMRMMLVGLTDVLYESFLVALRLGSPFIGFAIIANLTVGFINKLAVQIPIYFIALPFMLFGALVILYFAIPHMLKLFVAALPIIMEVGLK